MEEKGGNSNKALRLMFFASMALLLAAGNLHAAGPNLEYFWLALLIPTFIVAIAYMASYAFNTPSLRAILQDEILQILATGAIALTLVGTQAVVDEYVVATLQASGAAGSSINGVLDAASQKINLLANGTSAVLQNMQDVSIALGKEASKGVFCNFMGVGFSLSRRL